MLLQVMLSKLPCTYAVSYMFKYFYIQSEELLGQRECTLMILIGVANVPSALLSLMNDRFLNFLIIPSIIYGVTMKHNNFLN